jgi:hypothetical protein
MIQWTGPNQGKLRKALLEIYLSVETLRRFVRDNFERPVTSIGGSTPEDWAESLLDIASGEGGWINEIYKIFCSLNSGDPRILQLRKDLKDPSLSVVIGEDGLANSVVRKNIDTPLVEDPNSTHLVIAVFWQERDKQKIRISPKLHYRDPGNGDILQESLLKDNCSRMLDQFPDLLKELTDFTINNKLSRLFPDPFRPWKLTIELFVPVELLSQPLTSWCGQYRDLFRDRTIVVGCSDRFDLTRLDAINLYNQLGLGWERFQDKVPDCHNSNLQNLSWLGCTAASQTPFAQYAGFQCYGNWLKPDEQSLDNWQELVRSGIPLALWMCEGSPDHQAIADEFDYLIDGTRFAFLDKIRIVRDRLHRTCNHNVGIFYEDPHYLPDIPPPKEEQFLEWPGS